MSGKARGSTFAKLKKTTESGPDDWLVSFTDLATLLLCFFILLNSASELTAGKAAAIQQSIAQSFGVDNPQPVAADPSIDLYKSLKQGIGQQGLDSQVRLLRTKDGVELTAAGDLLFDSGSAVLTPASQNLVYSIYRVLQSVPYAIDVEGHTDHIPMRSAKFPSNWELSAARAAAVARQLIDYGIPSQRLTISGFADTRPAPEAALLEDSAAIRAANRRVVITIRTS